MNILVTGDSHCDGYQDAASAIAAVGPEPSDEFDVRPIGPSDALHVPFHDAFSTHVTFKHEIFYLEQYARKLPGLPLAAMQGPFDWYGFSGPLHLFDLFFDPQLYANRQPAVSHALLKRLVHARTKPWMAFFTDLRRMKLPCFVIESPLLFESSPYLPQFDALFDPKGLLELDRVAREFVKQALQALGVVVIEVPGDAVTPKGFMDERYRHPHPDDPHHGNREFSIMMLSRVSSILRRVGTESHGVPAVSMPSVRLQEPVLSFTPAPGRHVIAPVGPDVAGSSVPPELVARMVPESDGTTWLSLAARKRLDASAVASFTLPMEVAARISGQRVRISVLARSGSSDRGTRFALSLCRGPDADRSWRWFWADRASHAGYFVEDVPAGADGEEISIKFKANDSTAEITAPSELAAFAVEILAPD